MDTTKLLLDLNSKTAAMEAHMQEMKVDIREHIRRTALLEGEVKWLHKQVWIAHGAIVTIGVLFTIVKLFL